MSQVFLCNFLQIFLSTDTIILTSRPLRKCFNDLLFSNFKIFLRIFIHLARYTNRTLHKIQTRSKQFLLISFKNCFPSKQTIEMYRGCHKMNTYTFPFIYIHAFSLKKHFNTKNLQVKFKITSNLDVASIIICILDDFSVRQIILNT